MDIGELASLFSSGAATGVGGIAMASAITLIWREIKATRVELMVILKEQSRRVARLEDKVFPTGPSIQEPL